MKTNPSIAADLNLVESLKRFEEIVQTILKLGDLKDWDGSRFQQIEKTIREAGLELSGQAIALVLATASQSSQAHEIANERTQTQRDEQSQGHGRRKVTILTIGNVAVDLSLPYVIRVGGEEGKLVRGKRSGEAFSGGFYPFLSWLGLREQVSPLVWATITEYGMVSASFAVAQRMLADWGITISERRVERLTYRFGQIGLDHRQRQVEAASAGKGFGSSETLKGQRVVISTDGGRARLRRNKRGKRKASGRHGYHGDWREPLLLTIYVVDAQGKKVSTTDLPITNDGTFGHHLGLLNLLEMHLVRLGIQHAAQVLLLADGARWIWKRIPPLLQRLGCPTERLTQLLDFYHVTEYLQKFAELAFKTTQETKAWFKKARTDLKQGRSKALFEKMHALMKTAKGKRRQSMLAALNYLSKQPQRLQYAQVAAQKLPIGSGSIESLMRQVVNLRLKGNGKFWLPQHAEIMLYGRCQWAAGTWDSFCKTVLTAHLSPI